MKTIAVHFYKKRNLYAHLIRYFTGGKYSHTSVSFIEDGQCIEAIGGRVLGTNGVVISPSPEAYHRDDTVIKTMRFECSDHMYEAALNFAWLQVGKKYDYKGLFGFVMRSLNQKKDRWYCSELSYEIVNMALNVHSSKKRVNPTDLHDLLVYR